MTQLPDKLSDLLLLACDDMEKAMKAGGYHYNMGNYHYPDEGVCLVCFAGAVMAQSLKVPIDESFAPPRLESGGLVDEGGKMRAIDHVCRMGLIDWALQDLGISNRNDDAGVGKWAVWPEGPKEGDPTERIAWTRNLAADLQKAGY